MSEQAQPTETPAASPAPATAAPAPRPKMDPVRKGVLIFGGLCLFLLTVYMSGDRYTPFTTQARVTAFIVPIVPQVAGEILSVTVKTNQSVKKGQVLAVIDPERYILAVASAEAQLALTQQNLKVSSSSVDAAAAGVDAAKANLVKAQQDSVRLNSIEAEAPGAVSQRHIEGAVTTLKGAEASLANARANYQKAIEALGPRNDKNPQLLAARAALDQARLNLKYTQIVAPADGLITDLRVDVGNFATTGAPLMTFIADQKIWVEANLTENNLGHIRAGNEVDLVLDVWPDQVLKGRIRSVTFGVTATEASSKPGGLPTVQNARDWLRNAQRFPVLIDFVDPAQAVQLGGRVGSQVNVLVYTGDHPILNRLGRFLMWLSSILGYAY